MSKKSNFELSVADATSLYYLLKKYSELDADLISGDRDLFKHLRKQFEKQFPNAINLSKGLDRYS